MLTYTISVSIRSTLLRYSLFLSEYLSNHSNHSTCPDTRPDTINTRPRRRPSVQLETDRPGIEATGVSAQPSTVQSTGSMWRSPLPAVWTASSQPPG